MLFLFAMVGCRSGSQGEVQSPSGQTTKVYKLRGRVVAVDASRSLITVAHEAIPGFMEGMTMPFKLNHPQQAGELHPGDVIAADLLVPQDEKADLVLDQVVVVAQARPHDGHESLSGDAAGRGMN